MKPAQINEYLKGAVVKKVKFGSPKDMPGIAVTVWTKSGAFTFVMDESAVDAEKVAGEIDLQLRARRAMIGL